MISLFRMIDYLFWNSIDYDQEQITSRSRRATSSSSNHHRSNSNKGVRFNDDVTGRSLHNLNNELQSLSTEHGRLKHEINKTTSSKQQQQKDLLYLYEKTSFFYQQFINIFLEMTVMMVRQMIHFFQNKIHLSKRLEFIFPFLFHYYIITMSFS
jgi:hypothetical protein